MWCPGGSQQRIASCSAQHMVMFLIIVRTWQLQTHTQTLVAITRINLRHIHTERHTRGNYTPCTLSSYIHRHRIITHIAIKHWDTFYNYIHTWYWYHTDTHVNYTKTHDYYTNRNTYQLYLQTNISETLVQMNFTNTSLELVETHIYAHNKQK